MWKIAFWILFLAAASWEVVLHALEWRHLKTLESGPPQEMIRILPDNYNWRRGIKYAQDHLRLGLGETLSSYALMAVAIESGLYAAVSSWAGMTFTSPFLAGLVFGVVASATVWLVQLPWEWSEAFRVEESYGFNRASPALFWRDQLVKLSFLCAIGGGLLGSLTWLSGKPLWPLWGFLLLFGVELFFVAFLPIVVVPLFCRLGPLQDEALRQQIEGLLQSVGFRPAKVLVADASKRSLHGNAFLAGLGRAKRVVLFDTLTRSFPHQEILAIIGHELGHWKRRHAASRLGLLLSFEACAFFFLWVAMTSPLFAASFGLEGLSHGSLGLAVAMLGFISTLSFQPLLSSRARKEEFEADAFGAECAGREAMTEALRRLSSENLAWSPPHKLYAAWYHSHPSMLERLLLLSDGEGCSVAK